jgi:hypothetical protein
MRLANLVSRRLPRLNLRMAKSYKFSSEIKMDQQLDDKYEEQATVKALTTKVLSLDPGIEEVDQARIRKKSR